MNKLSSNGVNLSTQQVKPHDHLSLIYDNQEELIRVIIPFIKAGLDIGEKCCLLLNESLNKKFISSLQTNHSNMTSFLELGQLEMVMVGDAFPTEESFDPEVFSSFLESLYNDSIKQGYSSIRIVIDMSWALDENLPLTQLLDYESAVNQFYLHHQACGICLYSRDRFEPEIIINVLKTHRFIIYKQELLTNPFYTPPGKFDLTSQAERDATSMLNGLRELNSYENELLFTIRNLKFTVEINNAISGTMDMEKVMNEVINNLAVYMSAAAVAVMKYDPDRENLSYYVARGFLEKYDLDQIKVPVENIFESLPDRSHEFFFIKFSEGLTNQPDHIEQFQDENFSSYIAHLLTVDDELFGVLEVYLKDSQLDIEKWQPFIKASVNQLVNAIDNTQAYQALQRKVFELTEAYDMTLTRFAEALEKRDNRISRNTQRIADMTEKLAREMGASEEDLVHIRRGVLIESIGKMTLPERILNKTGPLDDNEWGMIQHHPQMLFNLLEDIKVLRPALEIPYCHHEHWDGSGYPRGLAGEEIPLSARQFAVVNVFDALLTNRPYRQSWQEMDALAYIRSLSGVHFDPNVVDAFLRMLEQ